MKNTIWILACCFFLSPLARAGDLVECQDERGATILQLRAEKKTMRGAPSYDPGGWWFNFQGEMYPPALGDTRGHVVEAVPEDKDAVTITIRHSALGPPVGVRLELRDLQSETPALTTVIFGGVVGQLATGPYRCAKITRSCAKAMTERTR